MQTDILLARQPIYDRSLNTVAYELLFRSSNRTTEFDGDQASSIVMLNAFTEIGINKVVGEHRAFINFTRNLILNPPPLGKENIVVEILENVEPDPAILQSLHNLKNAGYTLALDDFEYSERFLPFVELADIIKLDVLSLSKEQLKTQLEILKPFNTLLLAEKIETQEVFDECKALGFDYFQGYFLSKPRIMHGHKPPANKLIVVQLLAELQTPNLEMQKLHDLIARDATLSFKLLRLINSAAYRRPNKIESLYRAILMVGPTMIKHLTSMLVLSSFTDKPSAINEQSMLRAKMCESLAMTACPHLKDICFTTGMLSNLDVYFDIPMEELLKSVSLADEIQNALLHREGMVGKILKTSIIYEEGRWDEIIIENLTDLQLTLNDLKQAYLEGIKWSNESYNSLTEVQNQENIAS